MIPCFDSVFRFCVSIPCFDSVFRFRVSIPCFSSVFRFHVSIPCFNPMLQFHVPTSDPWAPRASLIAGAARLWLIVIIIAIVVARVAAAVVTLISAASRGQRRRRRRRRQRNAWLSGAVDVSAQVVAGKRDAKAVGESKKSRREKIMRAGKPVRSTERDGERVERGR